MANTGPWVVALPVLPLALLAFATWAVYLGGLASMQHDCIDADSPNIMSAANTADSGTAYLGGVQGLVGFSANALPCSKIYRFWWFVMAYEVVILSALFLAMMVGALYYTKIGFLGLFAVGLWLYILASNDFLCVQSVGYYQNGQHKHRIRTTVAGAIMTATANALIILALGATDAIGIQSRKNVDNNAYNNAEPVYTTTAAPVVTNTAAYPVVNTAGTAYPAPGTYPAGTGPVYAGNVQQGAYPATQVGQGQHVVAAPL